jgi:nucleoside-triphosphatase
MEEKVNKFLLTGLPGCGKTTVIMRLADMLKTKKVAGFYTQEIRDAGQRTGFSLQTFSGKKSVLSSINFKNGPRVGRYRVDIKGFEQTVLPELAINKDLDLYLIDEIGKMECFSGKFIEAIKQILDGSVPLVATVALKGSGFIAQVKERKDVELITVTAENRGLLPTKISGCLNI